MFSRRMQIESSKLGDPTSFAHMDPPPVSIAAKLVGLNAVYNQNMLHPELSPFATTMERLAISWFAPLFGMTTGHMCAGSTIANLSAIWCARESGARCVVASVDAHLSVAKSAHLLGLPLRLVPVDAWGRMDRTQLGETSDAAVVLTTGTTGRGVIDTLAPVNCRWMHVDAAWAGPLKLTKFASRLDGIECADSVAISAHKWLYQPKDSALVLFKSPEAQQRISYGGGYLAVPNVGVQGSRSAASIPLMATLLALGKSGIATLIEKNVADADLLAEKLAGEPRTELKQVPETGVVNWCPVGRDTEAVLTRLQGTSSRTVIDDRLWIRQVAANPQADLQRVWERILAAL